MFFILTHITSLSYFRIISRTSYPRTLIPHIIVPSYLVPRTLIPRTLVPSLIPSYPYTLIPSYPHTLIPSYPRTLIPHSYRIPDLTSYIPRTRNTTVGMCACRPVDSLNIATLAIHHFDANSEDPRHSQPTPSV